MPNGKVDEGEIALIIGEGGLKKATLARRKRIRAHFQAFTMENYQKDLTELINGTKEDVSLPLIQRPPRLHQLLNNHSLLMS